MKLTMNLWIGIFPAFTFNGLVAIFDALKQPVYITDYEHLGVCMPHPSTRHVRYLPGRRLYANNHGSHPRDTILSLPGSEWGTRTIPRTVWIVR